MKIACIILASGKSKRFGLSGSKLFYKVYGLPIIQFTLKNISKHIDKKSIYITIPKKITKNEKNILLKYTSNELIYGGKTRFQSLVNAVNSINALDYNFLMVHDAARPITPKKMIIEMLSNMKSGKYDCSLPRSTVEDTLRKNLTTVNRNDFTTYQTPQIFKLQLFKNHINKIKSNPSDDFGVIENKKNKVKFVESSKQNIKITKSSDVKIFKKIISSNIKFGNGFDIHKLKKGSLLKLAGIDIASKFTSIGHSDGDVVLHSIIDALLGASGKGDIGTYFPPLSKYKNISSIELLNSIKKVISFKNICIDNLDCTVICQKIRLEKYKILIAKNIAKLLEININRVNVKAKTTDNIGLIGKSKAIACWTTIAIIKL